MFRTAVIASGSKGNSIFIQTERTGILLDAGISTARIMEFLSSNRLVKEQINAILISHEHSDHIKGIGSIARKTGRPVFVTLPTFNACKHALGAIPKTEFFAPGDEFRIGDILVHAFSASHDSVDGCNFSFRQVNNDQSHLAVATDLGFSSKVTIQRLQNVTTLVLESNHDERMLMDGPYPWKLKQRVKSSLGHLSNDQAVGVVIQVLHANLRNLILAHLSETNNTPEIAETKMRDYLKQVRHGLNLIVASQDYPTDFIDI
ncbi:MAG TPA: MBL fold metallo-hydrolase [Candidatus Cloacimonadota bacterium]|nr:MBL fold metallo-hydrolase [Candidatus Cloacimonadota bacterium]HPT72567.1 MBL fold metallo-hydrolase [Candidatus Cloacimonadota bacterium]